MLPAIFPYLSGAAPVTALIGTNPTRAYRHGDAPQDVTAPYVTWFITGCEPGNLTDYSPPPVDGWGLTVDCWSDDDAQIEALAQAVRDALEPHGYLTGIPSNNRDATTRRYRISMQFEFWVGR